MHLPFKLSANGEFLMLSRYEGDTRVWSDSMHVGYIGENISYGRYPNGSDDLYVMNRMTFADANFYSSYNQPKHFTADDVSVKEMEGLPEQVQISYGYASRTLTVALPYDCELPQWLLVYDLQGRVVLQHTLIKPVESISVAMLPEGIYIVQVADHTMKIKINS